MPETDELLGEQDQALLAEFRNGSRRALARLISRFDNGEDPRPWLRLIEPAGEAATPRVIGITGPPGAGKSTLIGGLIPALRQRALSVAVLAIDPESPFTGGAILGDRIRMQGHASDAGIFIRSMATRGFLGGLARTTGDVALVLDAAGKQYVLVETVGVGQDEVDIVRLADCTLVLLVPGLGDDVQSMKAGLMEIADIFVLNKADREGADRLEAEIEAMLQLVPERNGWKPHVVRTVATENKGVDGLAGEIAEFRERTKQSAERQAKRVEHWRRRLLGLAEEQFLQRAVPGAQGEAALDALAREVADRRMDPYAAVSELLSRAGL